jgi:hypothetical protein
MGGKPTMVKYDRTGKEYPTGKDVFQQIDFNDQEFMPTSQREQDMDKFEALGVQIGKLVDTKQAAYGDSFGKSGQVMKILYPNGIGVNQIDDALAVVRILDKLFRIATARDALGESPYRDIAGYGLLGAARAERIE